jgi:hypothetical protein
VKHTGLRKLPEPARVTGYRWRDDAIDRDDSGAISWKAAITIA